MIKKRFLFALALLLNSQLVLALQFGRPIPPATVISVYTSPSEQSPILYSNINLVSVGECLKGWCRVSFMVENDKKIKTGWVKAGSINIQSSIDNDEEKKVCDYYSADPIVTASVNRFKCKESVFSMGYESCETSIDYKIETTCEMKPYASVGLNCSTSISTSGADSLLPNKVESNEQKSVYLTGIFTSGTIDINTKVNRIMEEITSAKLKEYNCKVTEY